MPGGYALFVGGKIFANITVEERIGVKLTVPWCFEELAAMPGASPWMLGQKRMDHWVLLPQNVQNSEAALRVWVERAHGCATGKLPIRRAEATDMPPPTARSPNDANGSVFARARSNGSPSISETPSLPPVSPRRRNLTPPPPSVNGGLHLASYAPPPPSSAGIRLVPKDSKSPYEETLVGVPAPPSSRIDFEPKPKKE